MTKKNFRANWEQVFVGYNDAELYAISVWVHTMQEKNQWNGFVGKVWDAYMAQQDKETEKTVEQTQPHEGQSVH